MRKRLVLYALAFFPALIYPQTPDELRGVWQGDDRLVFFGPEDEIAVALKEYYGWYFDRAAEPESFSEARPRDRNAASSERAQALEIRWERIQDGSPAWELVIQYGPSGGRQSRVPVAAVGDALYLDFCLRQTGRDGTAAAAAGEAADAGGRPLTAGDAAAGKDALSGFWRGFDCAASVDIAPRGPAENIVSWYVTDGAAYRIRYWRTDMEYEQAEAVFTDGQAAYSVAKHIRSGLSVYACVSGRGGRIRSVDKTDRAEVFSECAFDDSATVCAFGRPYLTRVSGASSREDFIRLADAANGRRKPPPEPLFPPDDPDWHWDLIDALEKDNAQIQAVRERQRAFGPRGKDQADARKN